MENSKANEQTIVDEKSHKVLDSVKVHGPRIAITVGCALLTGVFGFLLGSRTEATVVEVEPPAEIV